MPNNMPLRNRPKTKVRSKPKSKRFQGKFKFYQNQKKPYTGINVNVETAFRTGVDQDNKPF